MHTAAPLSAPLLLTHQQGACPQNRMHLERVHRIVELVAEGLFVRGPAVVVACGAAHGMRSGTVWHATINCAQTPSSLPLKCGTSPGGGSRLSCSSPSVPNGSTAETAETSDSDGCSGWAPPPRACRCQTAMPRAAALPGRLLASGTRWLRAGRRCARGRRREQNANTTARCAGLSLAEHTSAVIDGMEPERSNHPPRLPNDFCHITLLPNSPPWPPSPAIAKPN